MLGNILERSALGCVQDLLYNEMNWTMYKLCTIYNFLGSLGAIMVVLLAYNVHMCIGLRTWYIYEPHVILEKDLKPRLINLQCTYL